MTRTLEILDRLVAFDTVSDRSNLHLVAYAQDLLASQGFEVTVLPDPEDDKAGLLARIGPPGQGVLLSAHSDVVPAAGLGWTRDPFRLTRDGTRVYGRGTTDMKGFLACALAAAERAAPLPLAQPLTLVISYDEEVGCRGIARMRDRLAPALGAPRAAIVGEPTDMTVATGHKGKDIFRARCLGTPGHSALAPRFVNALHIAADVVTALRGLQQQFAASGARDPGYDIPHNTLHVGKLQGGRALNMVPELAEIDFELRYLATEDPDALFERITRATQAVLNELPKAAGICHVRTRAYPGLETPDDATVSQWAQAMAGTGGTTKVDFGTEAGFFAQLGIPTVVCGPGSMAGQGHKADEFIALDQLAACTRMLDRVLADLCTA